jgi:NADP-dependent 3-hydroxy acid dehydrogenase YdfG
MAMASSSIYKPLDISGRGALVTGTTSGIGRAIAIRLAELGCHVVLIGRRAERLEALKAELKETFPTSPEAFVCPLDVQDTEAIKALPSKLKDAGVPDIDILVNNAGMALGVNGADANEIEECRQMLTTNVLSVMAMVSTFAPSMKARGVGHIINISSVAGHECYTGGSAYCASKHAVNAFTIAARHDLAGTPIRVTAVSPGLCETEFSKVRFGGDDEKANKAYENIVPLVADDVADQVVYAATRPRHVQIADIISYCTNQGHAKYVVERKGDSLGAP